MTREIKRGEIYRVDWSPGRGIEQTGVRPALIIQNDIGNTFSPTTIVAACTTASVKAYPFVVKIGKRESGLPSDCVVNLSTILTIDKSYLLDKVGQLSEEKMLEIDQAIRRSLSLEEI